MVKKNLCILAGCIFSICCFSQKIKTVSGEYTYYVPENIDLEKAKQIALERVKVQLIADEFGTVVSQNNATTVKNSNGKSDIAFVSVGGSEVRGEWIETIGEPEFKPSFDNGQMIIKVHIKGKIREIVSADINFKTLVLRNGTEDKYEDDTFKSGDDLFLSFTSPISGYVAVYLVDNDGTAFCLLPYQNQEQGNVKINANERYVFFSEKLSPQNLKAYVNEYTMTCSHSQELNQIYVVFSPNTFVKATDGKREDTLPRELSNEDFQKWLARNRTKDKDMTYKKIAISIRK